LPTNVPWHDDFAVAHAVSGEYDVTLYPPSSAAVVHVPVAFAVGHAPIPPPAASSSAHEPTTSDAGTFLHE
jgi:hypothetical protein